MRSIGDAVKASFMEMISAVKQGFGGSEHKEERLESARITAHRLKAMDKPDYLKEKPAPPPLDKDPLELATDAIVAAASPDSLNKLGLAVPQMPNAQNARSRSRSDMSHFRLAAYVSTLSPEQVEAQEKVLTNDGAN